MRVVFLLTVVLWFQAYADGSEADIQWGKLRPKYHFLPASQWMNDPNAPLMLRYGANGDQKLYHLFFQYNSDSPVWGLIRWGHAISSDLVNWQRMEVAMEPTLDFDIQGVWSGAAVLHHDVDVHVTDSGDSQSVKGTVMQVFYTGVKHRSPDFPENWMWNESQDTAFSVYTRDSNAPVFEKLTKFNEPLLPEPPVSELGANNRRQISGFRDPFVFTFDDRTYLLVGSGIVNSTGLVLLYELKQGSAAAKQLHTADGKHWISSSDLFLHFEFKSVLLSDTGILTPYVTNMWECPQFFPVPFYTVKDDGSAQVFGSKWLLLFSNNFNPATIPDSDQFHRSWNKEMFIVGDFVPPSKKKKSKNKVNNNKEPGTDQIINEHAMVDTLNLTHLFDGSSRYYAASHMAMDNVSSVTSGTVEGGTLSNVVFGWIQEDTTQAAKRQANWSGIQAVPRCVHWCHSAGLRPATAEDYQSDDYALCKGPIDEIDTLRVTDESNRVLFDNRNDPFIFSTSNTQKRIVCERNAADANTHEFDSIEYSAGPMSVLSTDPLYDSPFAAASNHRSFDVLLNVSIETPVTSDSHANGNGVDDAVATLRGLGLMRFCFNTHLTLTEYSCLYLDLINSRLFLDRSNSTSPLYSERADYIRNHAEFQNFTNGLKSLLDLSSTIDSKTANTVTTLFTIRALLDESVAEIFLNNGVIALTGRIYPYFNESVHFSVPVFCFEENYLKHISSDIRVVVSLLVYEMKEADISDYGQVTTEVPHKHKHKKHKTKELLEDLGWIVLIFVILVCVAAAVYFTSRYCLDAGRDFMWRRSRQQSPRPILLVEEADVALDEDFSSVNQPLQD